MALTPSTMLPLGTRAPDFSLPNAVDGGTVSLSDFEEAKALLVMFICNHCPFVVHVREIFGPIARESAEAGLKVVAINSNSLASHAADGPEHMARLVSEMDWDFPFLFDADQSIAKAYRAACTPDYFLFDSELKLAYRGQLDDARPGNDSPVTGSDLRAAIADTLAGAPVSIPQQPSVGCNIKWTPGNEPAYFG